MKKRTKSEGKPAEGAVPSGQEKESARILKLLQKLETKKFLESEGVRLAYLFGSHVKDMAFSWSDVDVAVLFQQGTSIKEMIAKRSEIFCHIAEILHSDKVHVSILNDAPPIFRYKVAASGKAIYSDDPRTISNFEAQSYSRYFFAKPFL